MAMAIAILEDNADRQGAMRRCLEDRFPQFSLRFFSASKPMVEFLQANLDNTIAIALDHDLELQPGLNGAIADPGAGREVAEFLARHAPSCPVIIHTTNSPAATAMAMILQEAGWATHRVVPFDDIEWIQTDWFRTMRRAIVGTAVNHGVMTAKISETKG